MEMAAILIGQTSFTVKQVGPLVGYASRAAFRRAFADFTGESPSEYRVRVRRLLPRLGKPPRDLEDPGFWVAALAGRLDGDEAWELERYVWPYLSVLRSGRVRPSS